MAETEGRHFRLGGKDPSECTVPRWTLFLGFRNGSQLQEHRSRFRPVTELAGPGSKIDEPEVLVERDSFRFRVDDDAEATELVGHAVGEHEHGAQEGAADTTPLCPFIDGESRQAEDGKRILRQLLAPGYGEFRDGDFRGSDGREADDDSVIDRDVRRTDVMAELILSGVALEEPVEVDIARAKTRAVILLEQPADFEGHGWLPHLLATHQLTERLRRLARALGQFGHTLECFLFHHDSRRDDQVRG